jgi:regulator of sigma E protease
MAYVLALFAIGMLILVHEAGHYFVARWSGMRVERFSIGFGPALLKWRKAGTQFQIAPIFFGGFVHITGMNPHEEYDEHDPAVYPNRPTILRFLTILAGPLTNMVFATVLIFAVFAGAGKEQETGRTEIADVIQGGAAAGLLHPGDVVVAVDGQTVEPTAFPRRIQQSQGAPVVLDVLRDGQRSAVTVVPRRTDEKGGWLLGVHIIAEVQRQPLGFFQAGVESLRYPVYKSEQILGALWELATGRATADAIGPVGMTTLIGAQIRAGWVTAFEYLAMLNVYLCLVNLLPLPALDGGRLVFLSYELATRRRPNPKVETAVHVAGGVVLFILMILVTLKDIRRLFS